MGADTAFSWTNHTFNPWIGCAHVHEGCRNCYAEAEWGEERRNWVEWGPAGTRYRTKNWDGPRKWNRAAQAAGVRRRVFCASLADVFEDRAELDLWRHDLFQLIDATSHLDWLLLTKRPENISGMWPGGFRDHVWLGTSISDQTTCAGWIPRLLQYRDLTPVLFASAEPLLGPVDLTPYLHALNWVIVGGESGRKARPMQLEWARSLRNQCAEASVPFFFKQVGGREGDKGGKLLDGTEHCDFPTTQ